ncbi:MAG TPA: hypothetical protein VMW42_12240, partial [Desulfatiglandales bacterium]|nr:hypothetical protein [Desulfatiglandales bacterium]
ILFVSISFTLIQCPIARHLWQGHVIVKHNLLVPKHIVGYGYFFFYYALNFDVIVTLMVGLKSSFYCHIKTLLILFLKIEEQRYAYL